MSEYDTKPTIDTVLERIDALRLEMQAGFKEVNDRLEDVGRKQERLDDRVDIFIEEVLDMKRKIRKSA